MQHEFEYDIRIKSTITKIEWEIIFERAKDKLKYEFQEGFIKSAKHRLENDFDIYLSFRQIDKMIGLFHFCDIKENQELVNKLHVLIKAINELAEKFNNLL